MAAAPKAFVSYSHDSRDHRRWVLELSTKLVANGIDVTLDQWDLRLGDDVARFMEAGVRESDRVLVICTPQYVKKANEGIPTRGVGYERLIVTAHLVQRNLGTTKFIPIVRDAYGDAQGVPDFLGNRYHVDFRNDDNYNAMIDELLHEEPHRAPAVLLHRHELARQAAGQLGHRGQSDRRHDDGERPASALGDRHTRLPARGEGDRRANAEHQSLTA